MKKRTEKESINKILVDVKELQSMLSVGRNTAIRIGEAAGASLHIGSRHLYNVEKIKTYLEGLHENR